MNRDIIQNNTLIAQVYDLNNVEGTHFPTPAKANFQFGYGNAIEDKKIMPHIHKNILRNINTTSEFIFVLKGSIVIDIYDLKERFLETITLSKNMGLLQFIGGHVITIKAGTKYFEIKQGPYLGRDLDKYEFNNQ